MGQAFSGLDCCRSRDSSKKAEKKKSLSDHSNTKNEAVFKHFENEIKEEAIEEEDEKLQAKPSSEACTGPKQHEINESHQETKESPLEKKPENKKKEQNDPKIENDGHKIENGEKSENNEKKGENNENAKKNMEKKEINETSPLKITVEIKNEKKGMNNEEYNEKLAKRKAEYEKKLEASKEKPSKTTENNKKVEIDESQTLKVNNPEIENEKRKSANSEELKEKMARIKAELDEKKSKHEASKEKKIKDPENKEKATKPEEKNNASPLKLNKDEQHKELIDQHISSEAEKKENTETNKNSEDYKEKMAKRKAEYEKKTKLEGANKEIAAAKLAQMKQAKAAKNSQNNNNNNITDNHGKTTENTTHSTNLNNENQIVETEAVELKGEKTERKEKVKKSANFKKPQTEEDYQKYSEVKPYYKCDPSENSSNTESLIEKETELPKEQEVKNEIKPEEQKTELDSSRLLTHYIKKQLETIPENSLGESPREMVSKFISTSPGKRINKNLMERVKMLENLFGSQNTENNGDSVEMITDRTQSDNTFDVRLFRTYDPSRYKKQCTDGAALEHVTLERSPAKHLKTKSSLLYKSLDLSDFEK